MNHSVTMGAVGTPEALSDGVPRAELERQQSLWRWLLVLALVWILGRTSGEEGSGAPPIAVATSTAPSHPTSPSTQPTE